MTLAPRRLSPLALAVIAPLIYFAPTLSTALQYDRPAVAAGQFWRLITCHWTHWSPDHLLWSGGAFAVLAFLCHRTAPRQFVACIALSTLTVSATVARFTDFNFYRGLSGIDSALFTLLAVEILRVNLANDRPLPAAVATLLLTALATKITSESLTGQTLFVRSDPSIMTPVPLAHFAGAMTGLVVALGPTPKFRLPSRPPWTKMPARGGLWRARP